MRTPSPPQSPQSGSSPQRQARDRSMELMEIVLEEAAEPEPKLLDDFDNPPVITGPRSRKQYVKDGFVNAAKAKPVNPKTHSSILNSITIVEPRTYGEAMNSSHSIQWSRAISEELQALQDCGVYEVVSLPNGGKTIGYRWCFKVKLNSRILPFFHCTFIRLYESAVLCI